MQLKSAARTKLILLASAFLLAAAVLQAEDYLANPSYIAQSGRGQTEEAARQNALSELSKFFQMTVSVRTTGKTVMEHSDSGTAAKKNLSSEVSVHSRTELFAVHYTKAKYDKRQKTYEVVAFIDRNEAWDIFKPKLEETVQRFSLFYSAAEDEADVLLRTLAFQKAAAYAEQSKMQADFDFAAVLYPASSALYERTRSQLAGIVPCIQNGFSACPLEIVCNSDFENIVKNWAGGFFSGIGIPLESHGGYKCLIDISENKSVLPAGTFYKPSFVVQIEKDGRTIFSAAGETGKNGAKNERLARQRAYSALAECVEKTLKEAFLAF